jgi:predicted amidohydrolase YtcJ
MESDDIVLFNGKITTLDPTQPEVSAILLRNGIVEAIGDEEIVSKASQNAIMIDLKGRRVIPGLIDSHLHLIRGGLNYNMELRWDGVHSLADALSMLKRQADRTPYPQWVRVVGGWSEFQFKEKRMPTLAEINSVSPDTPVFILHLYDRALLNGAALRASGITRETPDYPGGHIERDSQGNPTGMIIAEPNALILYSTLAKGPKLPLADQINSTRYFMRELNRLGITSCVDAGGGFQNYPEDYEVIHQLHQKDQMTVRIAYNLFTQNKGDELADFQRWTKMVAPYSGDGFLRQNGAGEMLVFSAADFEDFLQTRPDMPVNMESELKAVVRLLAENKWPFRLHATYNETISRALDVFEEVNREIPFNGTRWFFDHGETVTEQSLERIKKLGGGMAIQDRMAFQGEYFVDRYGKEAAKHSPPISLMLKMGIPVGAGTDATRVSSYNPWVSLYWLVTGKTVGGLPLYDDSNMLEREEALRLWTVGSAYFSNEEKVKGVLAPGQYADMVVLSKDFFTVPEDEIKDITSLITIVSGKIVYATDEYSHLDLILPPVSPEWSPVAIFNGYYHPSNIHHHGEISHWLGLDTHQMPKFTNPWSFGCGCYTY